MTEKTKTDPFQIQGRLTQHLKPEPRKVEIDHARFELLPVLGRNFEYKVDHVLYRTGEVVRIERSAAEARKGYPIDGRAWFWTDDDECYEIVITDEIYADPAR